MGDRKYFGTDGIRGRANTYPMTAEVALRVGLAAGKLFRTGDDRRHLVVIGKDTRLSGYTIEPALVAGFASVGMDVRTFGPVPTPGVAMLTRSMRADLGVMISASHNDYADNGIKLFGPDGYKLSDEIELKIEALMDDGLDQGLAPSNKLGRVKRIDDAQARYIEIAKQAFPKRLSLQGLRIAVDCANGAGYKVAPTTLFELGAEVFPVGVAPNGTNINAECGSTHPQTLVEAVKRYRADIGIALDGDADRVIICDEKGQVVDGDQIMALVGLDWARRGRLAGGGVVATVMSNLGLERRLKAEGLTLERTKVGDRYVMERMR
ncbi:phosphoglucosamine mutase, partial [Brevundimonas sp.]|uniref:phosphoglucosamine mutase n=3 Tax=Caulobacteraceae TaxID=76892 RepID=UPI001A1A9EC8